ncbi:MAG: glutathione S-transferase N-terminal domain-containing protein [Bacteriovoracaceae bacterium]|nr:glutathione S-transferase N-terminal domain-containing protein [Bacteriovoracaceae bacterium]
MKLIGSVASPYVRRIRLQLKEKDYEFIPVNVFSKEGQELIEKHSPTKRVPILIDGDKTIWDSLLIARYLQKGVEFDLETEKELILINEANDSAINLFQLKLFGTDPTGDSKFSKIQKERINFILDRFESDIPTVEISKQWLFCLLDWLDFREVLEWKKDRPHLVNLQKTMSGTEDATITDPRH